MEFDNITVIPNEQKDPDGKYTEKIIGYFKKRGCNAAVGKISGESSLAVILGGDGSILRAARDASKVNVPLLGINLGRIGYMAELEIGELEALGCLFRGEYTVENRMMLDVGIYLDGHLRCSLTALNDAVLSNGAVARMVNVGLECNGMPAGKYHADGLIVSTPTGSTAYSLSAGGPVVDPVLDCFCVTPVSAHSLSARPMIFSPDSKLLLYDCGTRSHEIYLTVDGAENVRIDRGQKILIGRSENVTRLIRVKEHGFYSVLTEKLSDREF